MLEKPEDSRNSTKKYFSVVSFEIRFINKIELLNTFARIILANFWKKEVGTLEIGCDLDYCTEYSGREAIIARAKPSLF